MPNWSHIAHEHLAVLRLPPEREIEIAKELARLETVYEDALSSIDRTAKICEALAEEAR
jgi:uncharacterized coiled-coil DUF342 family protein